MHGKAETFENMLGVKVNCLPRRFFLVTQTFQNDLQSSVHNFSTHHIARALQKKPVVAGKPPVCQFDSTENVIFYQFMTNLVFER